MPRTPENVNLQFKVSWLINDLELNVKEMKRLALLVLLIDHRLSSQDEPKLAKLPTELWIMIIDNLLSAMTCMIDQTSTDQLPTVNFTDFKYPSFFRQSSENSQENSEQKNQPGLCLM